MNACPSHVGLKDLHVGDKVLYIAGLGRWHVEATATVEQEPSDVDVLIRVDKITDQGCASTATPGKLVVAGPLEIRKQPVGMAPPFAFTRGQRVRAKRDLLIRHVDGPSDEIIPAGTVLQFSRYGELIGFYVIPEGADLNAHNETLLHNENAIEAV